MMNMAIDDWTARLSSLSSRLLSCSPLLVALLFASGCRGEQPAYSLAAEPVGGDCTILTVHGEATPTRTEFEETHRGLVGESYVYIEGPSVFFGASQGVLDSWYIGDAITEFPVSSQSGFASVEMDYACSAYGPEIARVYWLNDEGERRVAVSLFSWQDQWYEGLFIETFKQENFGRVFVLYDYAGQDHYGSDVFLYADHVYLYQDQIGGQTGSQATWRAIEEAAIVYEFGIPL